MDPINLMVVGPEHACTRIVAGQLRIHPGVGRLAHVSIPSSGGSYGDLRGNMRDFECSKCVIVARDDACVDRSMIRSGGAMFEFQRERFAGQPLGSAARACREFLREWVDRDDPDVVVVGIEALFQWREQVLRQTFRLLGLDPREYPWERTGVVQFDWFSVDLEVRDPNAKYQAGKWPTNSLDSAAL